MAQLFLMDKKGTLFFHKDAIRLCPEFDLLSENERRVLVLFVDYNSPFNQLPESDRKQKSTLQVYGSIQEKIFSKPVMRNAVKKYMGLQFDTKRELRNTYQRKIDLLSKDLDNAISPTAINNIIKSLDSMRKAVDQLDSDILNAEEKQLNIRGGGRLSFIDELMSNQEDYDRAIALKA